MRFEIISYALDTAAADEISIFSRELLLDLGAVETRAALRHSRKLEPTFGTAHVTVVNAVGSILVDFQTFLKEKIRYISLSRG